MTDQVEIRFLPGPVRVEVREGTTLLAAARQSGFAIEAPCDGAGICGKCKVLIRADEQSALYPGVDAQFDEVHQAFSILACDARVRGPLTVTLPYADESGLAIVDHGRSGARTLSPHIRIERSPSACQVFAGTDLIDTYAVDSKVANLGIAVDIGTTTLVVALIDLETGKELTVASALNPQATYGHDVLSRIRFGSEPDGLRTLQRVLVFRLNELIAGVCVRAGAEPGHIHEAVLSGNTCMLHLALGEDPSPLGRAPFTPRFEGGHYVRCAELGLAIAAHASAYVPPVVSGFVGADITAGILATDLHRAGETSLLLDIGTNGEMVLAHQGGLWSTSTAAGPAFEGVNIECGMRAAAGAIDAVFAAEDGSLSLRTISDASPMGICGSGLIELVHHLIATGAISPSGRFDLKVPAPLGSWEDNAGRRRLRLVGEVSLTQKDVRQVQLAKAAIRAGLESLLDRAGITEREVHRVLVAGSFGYHLRAASLTGTGLLPSALAAKMETAGNTSKAGAATLLTHAPSRLELETVARTVRGIDLADDPAFGKRFVDHMAFTGAQA